MTTNGQMADMASTLLPYSGHLSMPPIQNLVCSQTKNQRAESFSPSGAHKGTECSLDHIRFTTLIFSSYQG